jgi:hypothetical protein
VVDHLGGGVGLEGGDVLPALDGFSVVAAGDAALGLCDQQGQVRLDAFWQTMIQGCMKVI